MTDPRKISITIPLKKRTPPAKPVEIIEPVVVVKKAPVRTKKAAAPTNNNPFVDTPAVPNQPQLEVSLGLIDLHPQVAKLSQHGSVVYLEIFTPGNSNSSRFEPARSITITGKDNIQMLATTLVEFLAKR